MNHHQVINHLTCIKELCLLSDCKPGGSVGVFISFLAVDLFVILSVCVCQELTSQIFFSLLHRNCPRKSFCFCFPLWHVSLFYLKDDSLLFILWPDLSLSFIHPSLFLLSHLFICPLAVQTFIRLFIHPSVFLLSHLFICPLVHPWLYRHSLVCSLTRLFSC